jgi:chromate transporter
MVYAKSRNAGQETIQIQPKWWILLLIVGIALVNEIINRQNPHPIIQIFTSFYRYGYSAMGGGQVVIPLMIQELVEIQLLIARADFLSGYAIDQAIPGPLFSFAAFVSARALTETGYSFFAGIVGGLAIFMPGILLVFFMFPLWRSMRQHTLMRYFLKGTTIAVAALITMTAINETISLQGDIVNYLVMIASAVLLLSKKIPAPLVIVGAGALGFLI